MPHSKKVPAFSFFFFFSNQAKGEKRNFNKVKMMMFPKFFSFASIFEISYIIMPREDAILTQDAYGEGSL